MCTIHMRVQCPDRFSELLVDDVEYTGLTIESILGTDLLKVFDTSVVENVISPPTPEDDDGIGDCR